MLSTEICQRYSYRKIYLEMKAMLIWMLFNFMCANSIATTKCIMYERFRCNWRLCATSVNNISHFTFSWTACVNIEHWTANEINSMKWIIKWKRLTQCAVNRPHGILYRRQKSSKLVIIHTYTFYDYRSGLSDFFFFIYIYIIIECGRGTFVRLVVIKFVAFIQT